MNDQYTLHKEKYTGISQNEYHFGQFLILLFSLISFSLRAQNSPRLVLPIGHNQYCYYKNSESEKFLYTLEDSMFIVWENTLHKEIFRKVFSNVKGLHVLEESESLNKVLISSNDNKLFIVDYANNAVDTLNVVLKDAVYIQNTSLFLVGNKDSVTIMNLETFRPLGKIKANIWSFKSHSVEKNQSGVNKAKSLEYLIYQGEKDAVDQGSVLILYDKKKDQLEQVHFDFWVQKVLMLDSTRLLLQRKESHAENTFFNCYEFNLKNKKLGIPVEFHKYRINQLLNGLNDEIISSGNDGRLVRRDRNFVIISELNLRKKHQLPSLSSISIDTVLKTIVFSATVKCKVPYEKQDSIEFKGSIDYYTFELIDLRKRLIPKITTENEFITDGREDGDWAYDDNESYTYGLDVNINKFKQDKNSLFLNDGTVLIDENLSIQFKDTFQIEKASLPYSRIYTHALARNLPLDKEIWDKIPTSFLKKLNTKIISEEKRNRRRMESMKYRLKSTCIDSASLVKLNNWMNNTHDYSDAYQDSLMPPTRKEFSHEEIQLYLEKFGSGSLNIINTIFRNKKVVFTSQNQLEIIKDGKNYILLEQVGESVQNFYLLKKNKLCDSLNLQVENNELVDGIFFPYYFNLSSFLKKDSTKLLNIDFTNDQVLNLIFPYPNAPIPFVNVQTNEHVLEQFTVFKLSVEVGRLKLEQVDSLKMDNFLDKKGNYFVNSNRRTLIRYKDFSIECNPKVRELTEVSVQEIDSISHFFVPMKLNFANENKGFYNDIKDLEFSINLLKQVHYFPYVLNENGQLFSNLTQEKIETTLKIAREEELIGVNLKFKIAFIKDKVTNFIQVRDFENAHLFSIILMKNKNYLIFDNDYRYTGTPDAIAELYFLCGTEIIELDQVKESLYVPNLHLRILNGEDISKYPKISDLSICGVIPQIQRIENSEGKLKYRIIPLKGGVGNVEIYVNGIQRKTIPSAELLFSNETYILELDTTDFRQFVSAGEPIDIEVLAKTRNNEFNSRGVHVELQGNTEISTHKQVSVYALMIGIDSYADEQLKLNYAAKDANDLHVLLKLASENYFNKLSDTNHVNFYNLTINPQGVIGTNDYKGLFPSKENIVSVLQEIQEKSKPEDLLLIFFAGHGEMTQNEELLLLTAGSTKNEFEGISMKELMLELNKIPAGKRVLILDACHSGAAITDIASRDISSSKRQSQQLKEMDRLANKSGLAILAASSTDQKALELPQYEHGLMTYALINTLLNDSKSLNENGEVILQNWFSACQREVEKLNEGQSVESLTPRTTFVLGELSEEMYQKVSLKVIPSLVIKNVLNKEVGYDNMRLESLLINQFEQASDSARQSTLVLRKEPSPLDWQLNVIYSMKGTQIILEGILVKNDAVSQKIRLKGDSKALETLSQQFTNELIRLIEKNGSSF